MYHAKCSVTVFLCVYFLAVEGQMLLNHSLILQVEAQYARRSQLAQFLPEEVASTIRTNRLSSQKKKVRLLCQRDV